MMRAIALCLCLAGCAGTRVKVICPALHPWSAEFQKEMAIEIRAHRQECPALVESAVQMSQIHSECLVR
ncbi:hypothetical protein NBRC103581_00294 [Gluconobacter wancherniae NBRC 103581]|nr:hypothetical protein NBRC103581_00294 [Gluconobacter wancherniae NBRC 103581]